MSEDRTTIELHDVTDLIGLRVLVANTAHEVTDAAGDVSIDVPDVEMLGVAAAVARCLMPISLRGTELRAIRHIADWTAAELASRMGECAIATVSRWENEKQAMGGYADKVFRLVVCEELAKRVPGVGYEAGAIAKLNVLDPWRADPAFEVPPLVFGRIKMRDSDRNLIDTWDSEQPMCQAA